LEVRAPEGAGRINVENARDADAHAPPLLDRRVGRAQELALHWHALDSAQEGLFDLDIVDERARVRKRRGIVEMAEGLLGLVIDQIRILLQDLLALLGQREHGLFGLDRALLAGEAGDVTRGHALGRARVDERARAIVRTEMAARGLVVCRRVLEADGAVEANE